MRDATQRPLPMTRSVMRTNTGTLPAIDKLFYAVRMAATQRKETCFPELPGDQQHAADEWLDGYLRLVARIWREHCLGRESSSCPQVTVDESSGTGKVRTADGPSSSPAQ